MGNKVDLVASGAVERQVSQEDAKEFASFENFDFVETSALTGEGVEPMFRRMVLSAARLLPDVKVNLELTGLPDGWISHIVAIEYAKPSRMASDDAATSSETNSDCMSDPRASLRRQSSLESCDKPHFASSSRSKPDVKMLYINYWTGEQMDDIPSTIAPTKLLQEAIIIAPPTPNNNNTTTTNNNSNDINTTTNNTHRKSIDEKDYRLSSSRKDSIKLREYSVE